LGYAATVGKVHGPVSGLRESPPSAHPQRCRPGLRRASRAGPHARHPAWHPSATRRAGRGDGSVPHPSSRVRPRRHAPRLDSPADASSRPPRTLRPVSRPTASSILRSSPPRATALDPVRREAVGLANRPVDLQRSGRGRARRRPCGPMTTTLSRTQSRLATPTWSERLTRAHIEAYPPAEVR
jgi:hypothetical protein